MQFRKQGKRIQVLAYRGYDKEKRRAKVKLLGSFDTFTYGPSDGLMEALTDDEKTELQSYIENMRQSHKDNIRSYTVKGLARNINEAADCLTEEQFASMVNEQSASEIYSAVDSLTKALRKLGYSKSSRQSDKDAA